jgi:fibronectin-binding autotransporter adhesin
MNRAFRSLWNTSLGAWVAAPETASAGARRCASRCSSRKTGRALGMGLALVFASAAPAGAATLYWDPNGNGAGLGGGGTWNTSSQFWNNNASGSGGTLSAWNNGGSDEAVFNGTAGTVTLGTGITVSGLSFGGPNYTITGDILTLVGAAPTISVAGGTQSISSQLASSTGFTKTGAGTLTLLGGGSTTTLRGTININDGVLDAASSGNSGALGSLSRVVLAAGATLRAASSQNVGSLLGAGNVVVEGLGMSVGNDGTTDAVFSGVISGPGRFVMNVNASAIQTLSGRNTFTGGLLFLGGTIRTGADAGGQAFGEGEVNFGLAGATLDLNGFNQTVRSINPFSNANYRILLGNGTLTLGVDNSDTTVAGIIEASGGSGGVQRVDVQVRLGQQFLELVVLGLQLAQAPGIGHIHAAVLGAPFVEGRVAEAALATQLLDRQASFGLPDETDDLLLGVPALSHVRHSPS